jgi:hypothetical protein
MKQHEREFFICRIRSGKIKIKFEEQFLYIVPPTFDIIMESCEVYNESYEKAYIDGIMDEEENLGFMIEHGLWSWEEEEKIKLLQKDIEKLKIEIYNSRKNDKLKKSIRAYIRGGEKQLYELNNKKNLYYSNTCEGIANTDKSAFVLKNTTYKNDTLYDFSEVSLSYVMDEYHRSFLNENQCRELSRNEPWKSLWIIKDKANIKLFNSPPNTDLTYNQKNIVIWSQMYDNVQESMECPSKDVIDDDDMLDGWFLLQAKKREQESAEKEFENETKSEKIKNASEVFVMAPSKDSVEKINNMNTVHGQMVKKQRFGFLNSKGQAQQHEFMDERLAIQTEINNQFKQNTKGGR